MLLLLEDADEVVGDCVRDKLVIWKLPLWVGVEAVGVETVGVEVVGVEALVGVGGLDWDRWCLPTRSRSR